MRIVELNPRDKEAYQKAEDACEKVDFAQCVNRIKVNVPSSEEHYRMGIGEGVWVLVDEEVIAKREAGVSGIILAGVQDSPSEHWPLSLADAIPFEMRGAGRPVVPYAWVKVTNKIWDAILMDPDPEDDEIELWGTYDVDDECEDDEADFDTNVTLFDTPFPRTKANFRAMRELCGRSQGDVAEATGVDTKTVRRWETPERNDPPEDAWEYLEKEYARHIAFLKYIYNEAENLMDEHDDDPNDGYISIPYFRDQEQFDTKGGSEGVDYERSNAVARAIAGVFTVLDIPYSFTYPDEDDEGNDFRWRLYV